MRNPVVLSDFTLSDLAKSKSKSRSKSRSLRY